MEKQKVEVQPCRSFAVRIENITSATQRVRILFPNAKKEENYGNPKGVNLTGLALDEDSTPESAYDALLHVLSDIKTTIGSIYVTAESVNAQVQQPVIVHTDDIMRGAYHGVRIQMLKDPYQNQSDSVVNSTPFTLYNNDGCVSGLIINVLPNAKVVYYLYTASTASTKSEEETNYAAPKLIRVLPMATQTAVPIKKIIEKAIKKSATNKKVGRPSKSPAVKKSIAKKSAVKAK